MIKVRQFSNYKEYVKLQGVKSSRPGFKEMLWDNLARNVAGWTSLFTKAREFLNEGSVLCLGARCGAEVYGAIKSGFNGSVGIDLHPCGPDVIRADWHFMPFENKSFPNVFTNSLDHCFDLNKLIEEVKRVLTDLGVFYFTAKDRLFWKDIPIENRMHGYEALFWENSMDLYDYLLNNGFERVTSWQVKETSNYILRKQ